ncbi:DUF1405 domain-containing protein [Candidatus Hodarchaeum mangrovi]
MKLNNKALINRIQIWELNFLSNKYLLLLLVIGNAMGAVIGFIYYIEIIGIEEYPIFLWILIPDCPMAVLLLLGVLFQGNNQRYINYNFFAYIQGIRGAIITYLIISNFGSLDIEIVIIGHTLLLIQSILILPLIIGKGLSRKTIIPIGISIFNDFSDFYGFGIYTPTLAQLPTIQEIFEVFVSFILLLDLFLIIIGLIFLQYKYKE